MRCESRPVTSSIDERRHTRDLGSSQRHVTLLLLVETLARARLHRRRVRDLGEQSPLFGIGETRPATGSVAAYASDSPNPSFDIVGHVQRSVRTDCRTQRTMGRFGGSCQWRSARKATGEFFVAARRPGMPLGAQCAGKARAGRVFGAQPNGAWRPDRVRRRVLRR